MAKKVKIALGSTKIALNLALDWLRKDIFRTTLSLSGVTIGVFAIVAILSLSDALQLSVERELATLHPSTIYIQQFPFGLEEGEQLSWWHYLSRPSPTVDEFLFLREQLHLSSAVAYMDGFRERVSYNNKIINRASIVAHTDEWSNLNELPIAEGRSFSLEEFNSTSAVAVIGTAIADALFDGERGVGETIVIGGVRVVVVGLLEREGKSLVNLFDNDNSILIPYNFAATTLNVKRAGGLIALAPGEEVEIEEFIAEVKVLMRSIRRVLPTQPDNFAINRVTFLITTTDQIIKSLSIAALFLVSFSILIGGFGVANIIYVSVKEQRALIGIQKAVGADRGTILIQYLIESILLSLMGGIVALLILKIITITIKEGAALPLKLSLANSLKGLMLSLIIGFVAGWAPANSAAKMEPIEAINSI